MFVFVWGLVSYVALGIGVVYGYFSIASECILRHVYALKYCHLLGIYLMFFIVLFYGKFYSIVS